MREILSCSSDQDSIIIKVRYIESQCYSLIINSLVYGLFKQKKGQPHFISNGVLLDTVGVISTAVLGIQFVHQFTLILIQTVNVFVLEKVIHIVLDLIVKFFRNFVWRV